MLRQRDAKMESSEAYNKWINLFDDHLYNIWEHEINQDFKALSMLLFTLKKEMKRIEDDISGKLIQLKNNYEATSKSKVNNTREVNHKNEDKENICLKDISDEEKTSVVDASNILHARLDYSLGSSSISSLVEEDIANTGILCGNLDTSPELKKKKKFSFSKKHQSRLHSSRTPSPSVIRAIQYENYDSKKFESTIMDDMSSMDFLNLRSRMKPSKVIQKNVDTPRKSINEDLDDTSVVQCTPTEPKILFSKKKEKFTNHSRKKMKTGNSSTLTQFVKKHSSKQFASKSTTDQPKVTENAKGTKDKDVNQDWNLNAFLAEAQNVTKDQLDVETVVRGKARKKLPGWSCKDCEKFYLNQGLNTQEIIALSKCSRHRGYNKPREETMPGFWNMDLNTQESDKDDY
ncbi:uncharacterized protein LOC115878541 isoform X2 [Sitophilus oryzae]|uniref:Uncharacterized protein LOC115878541 isoform X2 n=1 Tax=Sitophilus oryzae TaxID=7048 RepID=A0A6J2XI05_SITOR|nr:uncharacterized protein LOC115878541 isoform X2 [Sitophilus oryzae]